MNASQAIAVADWKVSLRAPTVAEWQDNLRPNQLRNQRGVWVPAVCRRDGEARGRRCGFWFLQVVEMARPRTHCWFAVFDIDAQRWQRSEIGCPSALTLEPAAGAVNDPSWGPPGSRRRRTT